VCAGRRTERVLIYGGKTGWLGNSLVDICTKQGMEVFIGKTRLEDRESLTQEIAIVEPDFVINAAGKTGRPNVDWCEDHPQETVRSNLLGTLTLFDVAYLHNIHVVNLGTGCIYSYDEEHPLDSGVGFTEEDTPNFRGSFYSFTKAMVDELVPFYPNVCNLRLRMPISDDLHPRSFITKIIKYDRVVNIPNSMTVLHDMLPLIPEMGRRRLVGNYNFINPGTISHNEILQLYKEFIDPTFTWKNFDLEAQSKVIKAPRSNNELDATKLLKEFPDLKPIKESVKGVFERMRAAQAAPDTQQQEHHKEHSDEL